jgi:hypothetical protein
MTTLVIISLAILAYVVFRHVRYGPRRYTPLASLQPARDPRHDTDSIPLGFEATDLDLIERTQRQNMALDRVTGRKNSDPRGRGSEAFVKPMKDDEHYARRYHAAWNPKTKDSKND